MIELDGTDTKARLGANATAGRVAGHGARGRRAQRGSGLLPAASADPARKCMPVPMMNIINGGAHADNSVDIQEFMVLPVGAPSFARRCATAPRSSIR